MALFKPGMFRRRVERESAPKEKETPAPPPAQCDVCGLEGHDRANCWAVIKDRADVDRTWGRSGSPEQSSGTGPTFNEMKEWWKRMQEER